MMSGERLIGGLSEPDAGVAAETTTGAVVEAGVGATVEHGTCATAEAKADVTIEPGAYTAAEPDAGVAAENTTGASDKAPDRLFTAVFVALVGVTLFSFLTSQGLNSGTSVYINRLGGSATLAGIGAAVFSGAAIVGRLVSGSLADRRGRFLVIVAGAVVLLVGVLGAAFSANLDSIMFWRMLQGLGFSAATTATATAAADVLPVERLGEGIGYYGLGQALAMSVGPAIAIVLVSSDPPENLFWGLDISAAISLVLCAFCRYEHNPERLPESSTYRRLKQREASQPAKGEAHEVETREAARDARESARDAHALKSDAHEARGDTHALESDAHEATRGTREATEETHAVKARGLRSILEPGALAGGIPLMMISPAFGFGIFFVGLLGTQLGIGNAGLFYTLSAVAMVAVRLSSKAFMDRVLPIKLFAIAVASGVVCYLLLLCVTTLLSGGLRDAVFYLAGIFYGLCLGMTIPVNQTVAVKNSPAERWGAANGLFLLMLDVGIGLASIGWGIINDVLGFPFSICCVIVLVMASWGVAFITYPSWAKRRS